MRARTRAFGTVMLSAVGLFLTARALAQESSGVTDLLDAAGVQKIEKEGSRWGEFLTDTSASSVSAAGMLGISGEAVTSVENVRHLTVALQGLGSNEAGQTLGLSITPARTSLAPMNLADYARSVPMRILGSLTLSYAQGPITLLDVEFKRNAWAIDTNFFFDGKDDPVIAYGRYAAAHCDFFGDTTGEGAAPSGEPVVAQPAESASVDESQPGEAIAPSPMPENEAAVVRANVQACHAGSEAELRWNRSQMSISYGDARIRLKDDSKPEESLGKTLAVSVVYGFDHVDYLRDNYALTVSYRRTSDEPVLATLAQPTTAFKDSSLFVARLTGGSDTSRVLFEFSNAKSRDITASQRAFKRALGLDYRITDAAWLNVRIGKQRKVDGSDDETGSLFTISYSPKALLKR